MSINYDGEFGSNGWGAYTPGKDDEPDACEKCGFVLETSDECECIAGDLYFDERDSINTVFHGGNSDFAY